MPYATREKITLMDGNTAFAAAPVNGATGAPPIACQTPLTARGLILHVNIKSGITFSLTFTIKAWDPYAATPAAIDTLLASAAKTANGGFLLTVYPMTAVTANVSASLLLPEFWRLEVTGTTDTAKITAVGEYIP